MFININFTEKNLFINDSANDNCVPPPPADLELILIPIFLVKGLLKKMSADFTKKKFNNNVNFTKKEKKMTTRISLLNKK